MTHCTSKPPCQGRVGWCRCTQRRVAGCSQAIHESKSNLQADSQKRYWLVSAAHRLLQKSSCTQLVHLLPGVVGLTYGLMNLLVSMQYPFCAKPQQIRKTRRQCVAVRAYSHFVPHASSPLCSPGQHAASCARGPATQPCVVQSAGHACHRVT